MGQRLRALQEVIEVPSTIAKNAKKAAKLLKQHNIKF
jgi:hypothetical protein